MTKRHILAAVLFLILTVANGQSFVVNTVDGEQHWIDQKELRFSRDEVTSHWELMTPESFQTGIALTRISKLLREYKPDTVNIAVSVTEGQFTASLDEAEVGSPCRLIFADLPTSISSVTVTDSTGAATTIHRSEFAKGIFIGNIIENNNRYRIEANRQDGSSIVLAGSVTVTGLWAWYGGKVNHTPQNASDVISAGKHLYWQGAGSYSFNAQGWLFITLAVPADVSVKSWKNDVNTIEDYAKSVTKKTIVINSKSYSVFTKVLDNTANDNYKFTVELV